MAGSSHNHYTYCHSKIQHHFTDTKFCAFFFLLIVISSALFLLSFFDLFPLFQTPLFRTTTMKQNMPTPPEPTAPTTTTTKSVFKLQKSLTSSQLRASSKFIEPPKTTPNVVNRVEQISLKNNPRAKRGLVMNKVKPNEEVVAIRRVVGDCILKRDREDPDGVKELLEKIEVSESLIKNLQSEVLALKADLGEVKSLNVELESHNRKLTENLAAAEAKVVNEKVRVQVLIILI